MTRFGLRISLLAAASLLFANIACTCAVAGTHAGHEMVFDDHAQHMHHEGAHSEHHHGTAAHMHEAEGSSDPSCHQILAQCPDCGTLVTPTIKQDRELRLPWIEADHGDKVDHLLASVDSLVDQKYAPALSLQAWRSRLPALGSPITRKDQLTE